MTPENSHFGAVDVSERNAYSNIGRSLGRSNRFGKIYRQTKKCGLGKLRPPVSL